MKGRKLVVWSVAPTARSPMATLSIGYELHEPLSRPSGAMDDAGPLMLHGSPQPLLRRLLAWLIDHGFVLDVQLDSKRGQAAWPTTCHAVEDLERCWVELRTALAEDPAESILTIWCIPSRQHWSAQSLIEHFEEFSDNRAAWLELIEAGVARITLTWSLLTLACPAALGQQITEWLRREDAASPGALEWV